MNFIEIKSPRELEEAFIILKELVPELKKDSFLESLNHELLKNHKLFGFKSSGKIVSLAAVWLLMTGTLDKIMWIYAFVVTKSMRDRGFGKKLLVELEKYAMREDFTELRVHAHREWAIDFWENKAEFDRFSHVLRKKIT
jgi:GNAT superfamily N-acetyltransferase